MESERTVYFHLNKDLFFKNLQIILCPAENSKTKLSWFFFTISGDGTVLWKQGERVISAGSIQVNFVKDLQFQQNWIFPPKINLQFAIWTETMTTKAEVLYNVKNGSPFITSKNSSKILSYKNKHSLFFQTF